jgi:hypothetical protein
LILLLLGGWCHVGTLCCLHAVWDGALADHTFVTAKRREKQAKKVALAIATLTWKPAHVEYLFLFLLSISRISLPQSTGNECTAEILDAKRLRMRTARPSSRLGGSEILGVCSFWENRLQKTASERIFSIFAKKDLLFNPHGLWKDISLFRWVWICRYSFTHCLGFFVSFVNLLSLMWLCRGRSIGRRSGADLLHGKNIDASCRWERGRHQASKSIPASQRIVNTHEVLSKILASKGKPSTIERERQSNGENLSISGNRRDIRAGISIHWHRD